MIKKLIEQLALLPFRSRHLTFLVIAWELRGLTTAQKSRVAQKLGEVIHSGRLDQRATGAG